MKTDNRNYKPHILQRRESSIRRMQTAIPRRSKRIRKPSLSEFDMLCYIMFAAIIVALGAIHIGLRHTTVDYKVQVQRMLTTAKAEQEQLMLLKAEEASKLSLTAIMENASYHGLTEPPKSNIIKTASAYGYDATEDNALRKEFSSDKYSNPNEGDGMRGFLLKVADFAQSASAANNVDKESHSSELFDNKEGNSLEKTRP